MVMGKEDIFSAAQLLLGFSKLSKGGIRQFTTGMNQYLFASPSARRQMIRTWEEEMRSSSTRETDRTDMER